MDMGKWEFQLTGLVVKRRLYSHEGVRLQIDRKAFMLEGKEENSADAPVETQHAEGLQAEVVEETLLTETGGQNQDLRDILRNADTTNPLTEKQEQSTTSNHPREQTSLDPGDIR